MKVIAVNGSPRKAWNTATLLQKAIEGAKSVGADAEFIHLYDLDFKGCASCFACKRKGNKNVGHCAIKDDLTGVLEKILESDVLLMGSPIYFANITGEMQSFLERLLFSNMTYNGGYGSVFEGKLSSGFIYTMNRQEDVSKMNVPKELAKYYNYETMCQYYQYRLKAIFNGTSEFLLSADTYQFDDYTKYDASMYDEKHKAQVKAERFPIDCKNAFDMGAKLASS